MIRNLFIVRHAQPHHSQQYNSDKERELKPEGIIQATQLGKYLNESNYTIDLIIASDAVRTRSTATLIADSINYPVPQIKLEEKIYSGDLRDLLQIINAIPESVQHLLLVGHNPTISELTNFLCSMSKPGMSTCELNLIQVNSWSALIEGCGEHVLNYKSPH